MANALTLRLDLLGEKQVQRRFGTLKADLDDPRPFYEDAAAYVRKSTRKHFETEGASGRRGRWAPLSEKYREWKEREYPGRPILVLTGKLRPAATEKGAEGSIHRVTRDGVTVGVSGSAVPYAYAHQHGIPGRLRQRPVYDLDDDDQKAVIEIARKHLLASAKRAGLEPAPGEEQIAHLRDIMRGS